MSAPATVLVPARHTRRVVTGHDNNGRSVIASDTRCAANAALWVADFSVNDAWSIDHLPYDNRRTDEGPLRVELEPAAGGNVFRIIHFPPDRQYLPNIDLKVGFDALGASGTAASTGAGHGANPTMHRTNTVDYIVIISGEIYCVMDEGETLLRAGDVLVQRGTQHAWSNRSDQFCVMVAVLNGALSLSQSNGI